MTVCSDKPTENYLIVLSASSCFVSMKLCFHRATEAALMNPLYSACSAANSRQRMFRTREEIQHLSSKEHDVQCGLEPGLRVLNMVHSKTKMYLLLYTCCICSNTLAIRDNVSDIIYSNENDIIKHIYNITCDIFRLFACRGTRSARLASSWPYICGTTWAPSVGRWSA